LNTSEAGSRDLNNTPTALADGKMAAKITFADSTK
jgi:hypothetical protein